MVNGQVAITTSASDQIVVCFTLFTIKKCGGLGGGGG